MDGEKVAERINTLGKFCGVRDVEALTSENLLLHYQITQADVMVLFGGSILCGGDLLAQAIQNNIAKKYLIVGGEGHTTQILRQIMNEKIPELVFEGMTEADLFSSYLQQRFNLKVDFLERNSTNCGNNVTFCLDLLYKNKIDFQHIIIVQDATMQRRMDAGFRKSLPDHISIINYAAYVVEVLYQDEELQYDHAILGMWELKHYMTLLMGEIPRLTDDANGYGPNGKNYIAHVEVPDEVQHAFTYLKQNFNSLVRAANPKYASK